jgi:hypothetical protein
VVYLTTPNSKEQTADPRVFLQPARCCPRPYPPCSLASVRSRPQRSACGIRVNPTLHPPFQSAYVGGAQTLVVSPSPPRSFSGGISFTVPPFATRLGRERVGASRGGHRPTVDTALGDLAVPTYGRWMACTTAPHAAGPRSGLRGEPNHLWFRLGLELIGPRLCPQLTRVGRTGALQHTS